MHVSEIVTRKGSQVHTVSHQNKVSAAVDLMAIQSIGSVFVCNDQNGELLGIISQGELLTALKDFGMSALDHCATGIMQKPAPTCRPDDDVASILHQMTSTRRRHMAVVDDHGKMIGAISLGDIVAAQLAEARLETGVLRDLARSRLMSA